jgi:acyl carrier protein
VNDREIILERVARVMTEIFHPPAEVTIGRETTAADIAGWDSLSHTMLVFAVEGEFCVELPVERLYALRNVGELVDLIDEVRPTLAVYGNCQAEGLAQAFRVVSPLAKRYRTLYVPSYDRPGGAESIERADLQRCDVVFEQHDPRPFPYGGWLRDDCRRVTFPSLDFNLLWPFSRPNPYNEPDPPLLPHGLFPYGHGIVVSGIERGLRADEVLALAMSEPEAGHKPSLERLADLERARLRAREVRCDVKIADYVFEHFGAKRLFWANDHPANVLFAELCSRLLAAAGFPSSFMLQDVDLIAALASFGELDLLGAIGLPIDAWVARDLELEWFDPEQTYRLLDGSQVSASDYYARMIDVSLAVKRAREESLEVSVE